MKAIAAMPFTAMMLALSVSACTQLAHSQPSANTVANSTQPNGYIVTATSGNAADVQHIYEKYGITTLRALGHNLFELRLQQDPGLAEIENRAKQSGGLIEAVQPNHSYKLIR